MTKLLKLFNILRTNSNYASDSNLRSFYTFFEYIFWEDYASKYKKIQMRTQAFKNKYLELSSQQLAKAYQNPLEAQTLCTLARVQNDGQIEKGNRNVKMEIRNSYFLVYDHPENKLIGGFIGSFKQSYKIFYPREEKLQGKIANPIGLEFSQIQNKDQKKSEEEGQNATLTQSKYFLLQLRKIQKYQENFNNFIKILQRKPILQQGFRDYFKLYKKLGKGASGVVYSCLDKRTVKYVAVKAYNKEIKKAEQIAAIQKEFTILSSLEHPNICQFYGVYGTQKNIYGAIQKQQYTLSHFIDNVQLSKRIIRLIMKDLLSGVAYMHKKGIMHRDLKLQNIMIKNDISGHTKIIIIDFSLAEFIQNQKLSLLGCGTPGYIAPQIFRTLEGSKYNQKCDTFSIGCIFYFLLFKKPLFTGTKIQQVQKKNCRCQIVFQVQMIEKIGKDCFQLLSLLLEKNPAKRISAQQALKLNYFAQKREQITSVSIPVE